MSSDAPMSSADPAAASSSTEPASSTAALPPPPKPTNDLIAAALTEEPQTSEMVYQSMIEQSAGQYAVPTLNTVQSALSTRGDKIGKRVKQGKRTVWVKYGEGESYATTQKDKSDAKGKKGSKRPTKLSKLALAKEAAKKEAAKKKAKAEKPVDFAGLRRKSEAYISKPMSAFVLFGLSQRGALKKQSKAETVREVVKAIGERWLLLGDEERGKYEQMASEEGRYCASRVAAKERDAAAAREAAAREWAAAEAAEAAAEAAATGDGDEDEDPGLHGAEDVAMDDVDGDDAVPDMANPLDGGVAVDGGA